MRALYDRYSGYATAVGLRYVPDMYLLKDVLQDSFIKVFTNIGDFNYSGEGSLKAWITRIVTNEAINFLPQVGLYIEPGLRYNIDNGSEVKTYFKKHDADFNLQLGVRVNFGRKDK